MSELAVSKKTSEGSSLGWPSEIFQPVLPLGRASILSPFTMMREFASEMDRIFHGNGSPMESQMWAPAMDVQQCGGNLAVSAELPGLRRDEVKVEVTDSSLVIQGERKREHKEDHEGYHRWERNYGRFYRAIPLPEGAKADQVKAELKDGILKVSIPVPETAKKSRQVPVAG